MEMLKETFLLTWLSNFLDHPLLLITLVCHLLSSLRLPFNIDQLLLGAHSDFANLPSIKDLHQLKNHKDAKILIVELNHKADSLQSKFELSGIHSVILHLTTFISHG